MMKVIEVYDDGSRTILLEQGDKVRFTKTTDEWLWPEVGELGTVVRRQGNNENPIAFLDVRTDSMAAGGWGTLSVPPWYLEYVAAGDARAGKEDNK